MKLDYSNLNEVNNFISMNRFLQSSATFHSAHLEQRPSTTAKSERFRICSTGESFLPNNTISNFRPQTSARGASSSLRNTKGKLQTFADQLATLLQAVKQTRSGFKEIQMQLNFTKEELVQRGIDPMRQSLVQEIRLLDKSMQIRKRSDMLRFQALNETCHALRRNSREIKGKMGDLGERLVQVQNLLGYHGLRDRLKY